MTSPPHCATCQCETDRQRRARHERERQQRERAEREHSILSDDDVAWMRARLGSTLAQGRIHCEEPACIYEPGHKGKHYDGAAGVHFGPEIGSSDIDPEPVMAGDEKRELRGADLTITVNCCTACGCLVGKDDEDWARHLNWHRLLRNLTTGTADDQD